MTSLKKVNFEPNISQEIDVLSLLSNTSNVDIGWSRLLKRCVVRIATGRACKTGKEITYTSATFDRDGEIQIRDPHAGTLLLPVYKGVKLLPTLIGFPFDDFTRVLYKAVSHTGIRFGVQLELIVHPDHMNDWHLVQIRPSPHVLASEEQLIFPKRNLLQKHGHLL